MKRIFSFYLIFQILTATSFINAQNNLPTIETEKLADNLYKFFIYVSSNNSVNIYALIGSEDVLLVDSGFDNTVDLVKNELKKVTNKKIRYIINTHSDGDHTYGNSSLGENTTIISHELCRTRLLNDANISKWGLPNITFQDSARLYFDGEEIVMKYSPGHTSTDIIVQLKKKNIVFVGDLVFSDSFPLVHPDGNIYSLEKNLNLFLTMFPEDIRILVGHGRELKKNDLALYLNMFVKTKELVTKAIIERKSPDEAKKEDLLKDWKQWNSKTFPTVNVDRWIDNIYSSTDEGKEFSAFNHLSKIYEESGLSTMLSEYCKMHSSTEQNYYFVEAEFNNWGYNLLSRKRHQDAIEVLKMNVEMYPESFNAYDSLGEAYMNAGEKELAIENYEKSLKFNSRNTNAVDQLKRLKEK